VKELIFLLTFNFLLLTSAGICFSQQSDTDPYFISGVSKYLEGEYQEAIPLLEKAFETNKKNKKIEQFFIKALVETAIICITKNEYKDASYYFEKALKINPKDEKLQRMLKKTQVLIAESKQPEPKQENIIASPQISDNEKRKMMSEHFNKATALFQQQKYNEAIKEWDEVLKNDPNHQQSKEMIDKAKKMLVNAK